MPRQIVEEKTLLISRLIHFIAIIVITSYVGHDQVRSAHRAAINGDDLQKLNIVRVFLLATIPSTEKFITQNAIQNEHEHFNDIVQGELHIQIQNQNSNSPQLNDRIM